MAKHKLDIDGLLRAMAERKATAEAIAANATKAQTETVSRPRAEIFADAIPPKTEAEIAYAQAMLEPKPQRRSQAGKGNSVIGCDKLSQLEPETASEPKPSSLEGIMNAIPVHRPQRRRWYYGLELYGPWLPETGLTIGKLKRKF